jgi:guanylate kinase
MSDTLHQKPSINNIAAFRAVLDKYRPSDETIRTLTSSKVVLLVAPTSAGRNTIINELIKNGQYVYVVSHTTRPKRYNNGILERDGVEYWFRSESDMLHELQEGLFIEAAVIHGQQVSGVAIREFEAARARDEISITEVEIEGAINMHRLADNVQLIFVLPPGFEEWKRRFESRGKIPKEEIMSRFGSAPVEIERALAYPAFRFVMNDKLEDAIAAVHAIAISSDSEDVAETASLRAHAEQLAIDTRLYLTSLND